MPSEILSMSEAAERLGIETADVFDLVMRRELGFTQAPSGRIQIPADALDAYLAGSRATSA